MPFIIYSFKQFKTSNSIVYIKYTILMLTSILYTMHINKFISNTSLSSLPQIKPIRHNKMQSAFKSSKNLEPIPIIPRLIKQLSPSVNRIILNRA